MRILAIVALLALPSLAGAQGVFENSQQTERRTRKQSEASKEALETSQGIKRLRHEVRTLENVLDGKLDDVAQLQDRIASLKQRIATLDKVTPAETKQVKRPESDSMALRESLLDPGLDSSSDADAHWERVSTDPRVIFANSYDDPSDYADLIHASPHNISKLRGAYIFHDAAKKATRFFIPEGEQSLPNLAMFEPRWDWINDDLVCAQWEVMYDPATTSHGGKSFQLLGGSGLNINLELRTYRIGEIGDYKVLYGFRWYGGSDPEAGKLVGGNGLVWPLSIGEVNDPVIQFGPGLHAPIRQIIGNAEAWPDVRDGGSVYYGKPGEWIRLTVAWDMREHPARLKFWMNDRLVLCDPEDSSKGFILDPGVDSGDRGLRGGWIPEFNNSSTKAPMDISQWVRRFVAWKGAEIPRN